MGEAWHYIYAITSLVKAKKYYKEILIVGVLKLDQFCPLNVEVHKFKRHFLPIYVLCFISITFLD